jgi:AcrR family transcriptional regulator
MTESEVSGDTEAAIVRATYRALCANGYADTTVSAIAAEFEKSKSLLYYHYDDKEALLDDFLRFMLERLESDLTATADSDPEDRLWAVIDRLLPPDPDEEGMRFRRALLEIRANAPHSEAYHERFRRSDEVILGLLADALRAGVEAETFRDVDPTETAEFLYATAYGGLERAVTLDDPETVANTRRAVDRYLDDCVRAA